MHERTGQLSKPQWSAWLIIPPLVLSLMATVLTAGCDSESPSPDVAVSTSGLTPTIAPTRGPTASPTPASSPTEVVGPMVPLFEEVTSTGERGTPPATDLDLAQLVNGNSAFAFDLYRALAAEEGNLFFSPHSISLALTMAYAGARGETERQMADTLHLLLPENRLHPAFNTLELRLASSGRTPDGEYAGFRLNVANAVWGQKGYGFLKEFLDVLEENYGAGVRPVDFAGAPEESRLAINDWVAEQTENRVEDLILPEVIDEDTRLVLTNAVYFNARWLHTFDENSTHMRPFYLLDGSEVAVPMMSESAFLGYARGEGYQAVDLPYNGSEVSMTILLPDKGRFRQFEDSIDATLVRRILAEIETQPVSLTMPKFEFESEFRLDETLKNLGMPDAFNPGNADFSGIDGRSCPGTCLVVDAVVHKAFVSVDERGTEAAAVTGVIWKAVGELLPRVKLTVDRPFIFLIQDKATDSILFLGRMELAGDAFEIESPIRTDDSVEGTEKLSGN